MGELVAARRIDIASGVSGHVADVFDKSYEGWCAYVCGNKEMIAQTAATLEGTGIKRENIHYEKFY